MQQRDRETWKQRKQEEEETEMEGQKKTSKGC